MLVAMYIFSLPHSQAFPAKEGESLVHFIVCMTSRLSDLAIAHRVPLQFMCQRAIITEKSEYVWMTCSCDNSTKDSYPVPRTDGPQQKVADNCKQVFSKIASLATR